MADELTDHDQALLKSSAAALAAERRGKKLAEWQLRVLDQLFVNASQHLKRDRRG